MMKLTFLGTRSSLLQQHPHHRQHSSLLVECDGHRVMIDCGGDFGEQLSRIAPDALVLTHAHEDHAGGLAAGSPCPVHLTEATARILRRQGYDPERWQPAEKLSLVFGRLRIRSFAVYHSLRAPAVGLRLEDGRSCCIYLSDVAMLGKNASFLAGADLYIGDGTCFGDELVRIEQGVPCGHAAITSQLAWAATAGIRRVLMTHCGPEICRDEDRAQRTIAGLGARLGLQAAFARDGQSVVLAE
ncbi:ribonuclease BN (tRNA processing enzyme) [Geothermobacter ehrlichii]|uniref:Ribonuclease BN (tRNA processing enzyme) n=2 Tax=Geothermobacter ehrlichii TaxID=213224 RepID=A0A5D3WG29_9BACT|nr:ribonuclease BN (tRNA processing enzyme) [Geothermobacter ehrlichii]